MAGVQATGRKGQWPVAGINAGVGLTILILVAVLALVVNPPAPPGIAAFAPQANKPITKAPLSQSASFGEGDGDCAAGQNCDARSVTSTTLLKGKPRGVPSSLQCYEWPDGSVTQTFDPQSPPCIATWDDSKGNGGATSPGVTTSEIRVALPIWETAPGYPTWKPIVDFFNTRFQFYGRKITIVPVISQQAGAQATGDFHNPEMQRADATQLASQKVFATTDFVDPLHYSWSLPVFRDVLTRNKIVSLHGGEMVPYGSAADLNAKLPYEWTYYQPMDTVMRDLATVTCRQLVGRNAIHSTDPNLHTVKRKFAVMLPEDESIGGPMPGLNTMLSVLGGCGVEPRVVRFSFADRTMPASMAATMRELQNDGVTSIVWFPTGGGGTPRHPWSVADSVGYRPEWVMIGWNKYQVDFELQNPESQTGGAFGIGVWNKMPQLELEFFYRAFLAAGGRTSDTLTAGARAFYNEMLLLASGIQMAGPKLTPESFAKGLQSTTFPNPGAGIAPFYQGSVGFGPGDSTMVDDMQAFWLDTRMFGRDVPQQKAQSTGRATCYVDFGRRYFLANWPSTDGFYAPNVCR